MLKRYFLLCVALCWGVLPVWSQDRLKSMPGYANYQKMSGQTAGTIKRGTLSVTWKEGGKAFEYSKDGKRYRFDIAANKAEEVKPGSEKKEPEPSPGKTRAGRRGNIPAPQGVGRGRQATTANSPDGKLKATYKNRNLFITDDKGENETPITTDGSEAKRIKYGTASWVYGEELYQNYAMWWSPDSKKLAYYRFDESKVKDFYLQLGQTRIQSVMNVEPYPKTGDENPVVDLFVYDVDTKNSVRVDVRGGKPFENDVVGYYVYAIEWSPDGKELLFNRTNRRQNVMEFTAANPTSGSCRVIVREEWLPSWTENLPKRRFLDDKNRFIWTSTRNGYKNFQLYDLSGKLHAQLTNHEFEVIDGPGGIVRVDEERGHLYYMARDGENTYKEQLHRVGLDGKGDVRLTDPKFHHRVDLAPDGKHFIDTYQTHAQPESTRLVNDEGKVLAELNKYDMSEFESYSPTKLAMEKPTCTVSCTFLRTSIPTRSILFWSACMRDRKPMVLVRPSRCPTRQPNMASSSLHSIPAAQPGVVRSSWMLSTSSLA
jgi:dipeptidyl-peptidase-4